MCIYDEKEKCGEGRGAEKFLSSVEAHRVGRMVDLSINCNWLMRHQAIKVVSAVPRRPRYPKAPLATSCPSAPRKKARPLVQIYRQCYEDFTNFYALCIASIMRQLLRPSAEYTLNQGSSLAMSAHRGLLLTKERILHAISYQSKQIAHLFCCLHFLPLRCLAFPGSPSTFPDKGKPLRLIGQTCDTCP